MVKAVLVAVGSTLLLLLVLTPGLEAQTGWKWEVIFYPDSAPSGSVGCSTIGPWMFGCWVPVSTVVVHTPLVWCPTCGKFVPAAGSPINLTNGNTYIQETDLSLPGLGGGLSLTRTWNSIVPGDYGGLPTGIFGGNWRSTFEERLTSGSGTASNYMMYLKEDGGIWFFGLHGSTWSLVSPASLTATLTLNANQTWTIQFQNGEQRVFSAVSGSLIAIVDRNGNAKQLSYDGQNRLTTVADAASRHLFFNYPDNSSGLVSSVTSDFGITLSYTYDSQGRLVQVTNPDQTTISFAYDSNSMITAVQDSQGKLLESHSYDSFGRGITSSRANGVDAVTVSYPND